MGKMQHFSLRIQSRKIYAQSSAVEDEKAK
jgi:hypothetical protein